MKDERTKIEKAATGEVPLSDKLAQYTDKSRTLFTREIWELEHLGASTLRARLYMLLRILALTWQGVSKNRLPVQSAALTFYSLIGIGPLIALGIMLSSFALEGSDDQNLIVDAITKSIAFAAPQLTLDIESGEAGLAPELTDIVNNFISAAQSGTVGVLGSLMLFFIGIQVLSSIEGSFNSLWGVKKGRKIGEKIVTYWTFISLGAVIGTASLTLIGLNAAKSFMEKFPFGGEFFAVFLFFSPVIIFLLLVLLLGLFFRFIPNTQVKWIPAFTGAAVVVLSLYFYNQLSFLYVQRVVDTRSLYGSVGIIIVLMLGLYIFWLLILFGGQLTYAVQNADFLTNESAWQNTSERSKEVVSLAVLLMTARRFDGQSPPIRANEIHEHLRVPSNIINTCINRLCELGYLTPIEGNTVDEERNRAYQPGRPLDSLTLGEFKKAFERHGNNDGVDFIVETEESVQTYIDEVLSLKNCTAAKVTIHDLITTPKGDQVVF